MPESFEEHFTTAKEESPSDKREEGLTKTVQDYQKITDLIREIETFFEGEKRDYESEVQTIVNNLQEALEQGADPMDVAYGLAGVGTEAAMKLRERLLEQGADPKYVAQGLAGVGTEAAMELRERLLLEQGADSGYVALGLAGVGTEAAMELREELLEEGANPDDVAHGLAGVNTPEAEEFRRKYFGHDPTLLALSYSNADHEYDGFICRYGYEK